MQQRPEGPEKTVNRTEKGYLKRTGGASSPVYMIVVAYASRDRLSDLDGVLDDELRDLRHVMEVRFNVNGRDRYREPLLIQFVTVGGDVG